MMGFTMLVMIGIGAILVIAVGILIALVAAKAGDSNKHNNEE